MTSWTFEWDGGKDLSNQSKHGVSFEEARALFESDVEYLELFDSGHSATEERFLAIGPTDRGLIVVAWTVREECTIRIISARKATRREARLFHERMRGSHV
jgi:uncharacterized DUF497 family protein